MTALVVQYSTQLMIPNAVDRVHRMYPTNAKQTQVHSPWTDFELKPRLLHNKEGAMYDTYIIYCCCRFNTEWQLCFGQKR